MILVKVCSWCSTAHACARTILYGLWTDAIAAIKYLEPKIAFQYLWIWRDLVTNVLYYGQCRAWRSHFKNIISCCNFTEAKSCEVCTVLQGVISQKPNDAFKKRFVWPSSRLKTVDLDYRSSLSVARLVRFWFKSLQSLTAHDRQFLQGNLFFLAVCTHEVPLYLCSIFCSRSLVQVSTASYRILSVEHAPNCIP